MSPQPHVFTLACILILSLSGWLSACGVEDYTDPGDPPDAARGDARDQPPHTTTPDDSPDCIFVDADEDGRHDPDVPPSDPDIAYDPDVPPYDPDVPPSDPDADWDVPPSPESPQACAASLGLGGARPSEDRACAGNQGCSWRGTRCGECACAACFDEICLAVICNDCEPVDAGGSWDDIHDGDPADLSEY